MDPSSIVTAIQQASAAIFAVGGAVLSIVVAWKGLRWMLASIDAEAANYDLDDEDDVSRVYGEGDTLACENCDYELDEDAALTALDNGYCPKCGHEVSW